MERARTDALLDASAVSCLIPTVETARNSGVGEVSMLICPIKNCGAPLAWEERLCVCPRGHSFDRARSGYVNLLTPQDKRAKSPGDSKETVRARRRLLESGIGDHVLDALVEIVSRRIPGTTAAALDVGCGEGHFLTRLAARFPLEAYGVDLSSAAVDAAARRAPALRWIAANADRHLPFSDNSFDFIFSITSRKNASEFARLLAPRGLLVVVVPAADDLAELKEAVLGGNTPRDREARTQELLTEAFALERRTAARAAVHLGADALRDLLSTTYRGARKSEAARARLIGPMTVTASSEILCFARTEAPADAHLHSSCESGK